MAVSYNRKHYVFRMLGHFGTVADVPADSWSSGLRLATPGEDVALGVDLTPFLETVSTAIATFHTSSAVGAGSSAWLDELTIARVGLDGKYDPPSQETTRYAYGTKPRGGGSGVHPWSTAMVTSLRTGFPRGIASNGRMYWPATALALDNSTGRIDPSGQDAYILAARNMINAVNDAATAHIGALVRVSVVGATGKTGSARVGYVERIRCDRRLDSIERRENDQGPDWAEQSISP